MVAALNSLLVITLAHAKESPAYTQFLDTINKTAAQIYHVPNSLTEEVNFLRVYEKKSFSPVFITDEVKCNLRPYSYNSDWKGHIFSLTFADMVRNVWFSVQVVNESLTKFGRLPNGRYFSHEMYNRSFDSVSGQPFRIDENGDRDALYTVLGVPLGGKDLQV